MIKIEDKADIADACLRLAALLQRNWDGSAPVELSAKPWQDRRTRSQNALYRVWCREIANTVGRDEDDVHDLLRFKFLGHEQVEVGADTVTRLRSTAKLGKAEMADYMTRVEAWALELGVMLPVPADNEYMTYREASQ